MRNAFRPVAVLCTGALALTLVSCGSDGGSDEASTTTAKATTTSTTIAVDVAVAAFCGDAKSYLTVLSSLSNGIEKSTTTVGDLESAADEAREASAAATSSKDDLIAAIEAHAAAAEATDQTTTTLMAPDVASRHLAALEQAEEDAAEAVGSIDEATVLSDASASVQAAAFNLALAWGALYRDAGCLDPDSAGAAALHDVVAGLQGDLKAIGLFSGEIDGLYGPETMAAVSTLQKDAGLPETGFMDPATQKVLAAELAKADERESLEVAAIQGALRAAGFYTGPIDGVWSQAVDDALRAFQADQDQEEDATLDPAALIALGAKLALEAQAQSTTTTAPPTTTAPTTAAPTTAAPTTAAPETTTEVPETTP